MEDDNEKYKGYDPTLFKDAKLSDIETELLLGELENSNKKGKKGCYIALIVSVLLVCFFAAYQIDIWTDDTPSGGGTLFRFLLVPVAIFMAIGIKVASTYRSSDQAGYKMKKDWRKPVLYLRSFQDDMEPGIEDIKPSLHLGNIAKLRYSSEALIKGYFGYYAPTIGLCKPGEEEVYGVPNRIIINGSNWKSVVSVFIKVSSIIVFMATEKISDSIEWELNEILKLKTMDKILFFIPKNLSEEAVLSFLQKLENHFGKEIRTNQYSEDFFIAFIKEENCFQEVAYPKQFIKELFK